jgi:hypothetical protein
MNDLHFFHTLTKEMFQKLIWIPEEHLKMNWKNLIDTSCQTQQTISKLHDIIKHTHKHIMYFLISKTTRCVFKIDY